MALKNYNYTAKDKNGASVAGTYRAETREKVAEYLRERELFIVGINQNVGFDFKTLSNIQIGGIPFKEKMILVKQMSTMLQAGLPVLQSLEILAKQLENPTLKDNLAQVQAEVEGGSTLSAAFIKHTKIFSELQINLLIAGEKSGNLVEIIAQIAEDMEKTQQLTGKIRSALIYPAIIFVAITIVMIILITFMIPTVKTLYADFNAVDKIPDITKFLISFSDFLQNPLGLIAIGLSVAIAYLFFRSFKASEAGRLAVANLTLKIPLFGTLIQKMQLSQFGRLLSMLLRSGVPIIEALKIVSKALSNPVYQKAVAETVDSVAKGLPLAVPLAASGAFPLIYIRMISTGEQTGNLDKVLADMGKYYEAEVNDLTNNLTKLMEPLILMIVGGMVAFLAVAVYLPIYNIGNVIT